MIANKAPAPNRRPLFLLAAQLVFDYLFCVPPPFSAAAGEAQR
jgi:hypothetical protein